MTPHTPGSKGTDGEAGLSPWPRSPGFSEEEGARGPPCHRTGARSGRQRWPGAGAPAGPVCPSLLFAEEEPRLSRRTSSNWPSKACLGRTPAPSLSPAPGPTVVLARPMPASGPRRRQYAGVRDELPCKGVGEISPSCRELLTLRPSGLSLGARVGM
uniref:Uncharacterized protein n=1 Tax=Molossus molossus TaxID=27622 RepID=A0A7J8C8Z4_MOLMO|nr:hypothetical protein HJG59_009987 [Molossus molossus]